jgi:hypothetical protein
LGHVESRQDLFDLDKGIITVFHVWYNVAEYRGLIAGLEEAHRLAQDPLVAADLERLAAGVAPDAPLAAQLVSGGLWDTLLAARLPDDETRAAAIVAAGVPCGGQKEG